ncbi:HEAT repeat domain-containing protein [Lujinxingia sediminis]|uniref:HEAT repeat domain-containing protein n=1 Tax=Lujinxingia sediminis TaxID=2480984 RepID=A0ABY0CQJ2_9DELT|nr:HEAT repeat domain-containing protein [Lujinxingia sediminis]RVU42765.1 HEAT repeat domain-containing protein [Lujinxingia sediminis]
MKRPKLVTDVSEWGLMRWPARTRARLVITSLAFIALATACAFISADYILNTSASVMLNLVLITANLFLLLVTAFLQAALIGEFFFSPGWRQRVLLGEKPASRSSLSDDLLAVHDHNAEFIAIIAIALFVNGFAINQVIGGFFDAYHNEAFFQVRMRSDDPEERLASLTMLADPLNNQIWERPALQEMILEGLGDPETSVRQRAAWTAGALLVRRADKTLSAMATDDPDPQTRARAAHALGKLPPAEEHRLTLERLITADQPLELRLGAFRGLAAMADAYAVPTILTQIDDPDETVAAYAYWALARIGSADARDQVKARVDTLPHGPRRCAALEAFKMVSTKEDTISARRHFQRVDPELYCEPLTFEEPDENIHHVVWGESVRLKWLKVVGNTDPFSHEDWMVRLVNDPEEDVRTRDVADEILRQMRRVQR